MKVKSFFVMTFVILNLYSGNLKKGMDAIGARNDSRYEHGFNASPFLIKATFKKKTRAQAWYWLGETFLYGYGVANPLYLNEFNRPFEYCRLNYKKYEHLNESRHYVETSSLARSELRNCEQGKKTYASRPHSYLAYLCYKNAIKYGYSAEIKAMEYVKTHMLDSIEGKIITIPIKRFAYADWRGTYSHSKIDQDRGFISFLPWNSVLLYYSSSCQNENGGYQITHITSLSIDNTDSLVFHGYASTLMSRHRHELSGGIQGVVETWVSSPVKHYAKKLKRKQIIMPSKSKNNFAFSLRDQTHDEIWQSYISFIIAFPELSKRAKERFDLYSYKQAKEKEKLKFCQEYIDMFPNGKHRDEVLKLSKVIIDRNAFDRASNINTIFSYKKYISEHSEGNFISIAKGRIDEIRYENALEDGTKSALVIFLNDYPESQFQKKAKMEIAWFTAKQINTEDSYSAFLKAFPSSNHNDYAKTYYSYFKYDRTKILKDLLSFYKYNDRARIDMANRQKEVFLEDLVFLSTNNQSAKGFIQAFFLTKDNKYLVAAQPFITNAKEEEIIVKEFPSYFFKMSIEDTDIDYKRSGTLSTMFWVPKIKSTTKLEAKLKINPEIPIKYGSYRIKVKMDLVASYRQETDGIFVSKSVERFERTYSDTTTFYISPNGKSSTGTFRFKNVLEVGRGGNMGFKATYTSMQGEPSGKIDFVSIELQ